LNEWEGHRNDPFHAFSSIAPAETADESTIDPAADVSETGATYNDVYQTGAMSIDIFEREATYNG